MLRGVSGFGATDRLHTDRGILILTKEAVDLMIIALYQPVTWAYASGSVVDVLVSVAGVELGLLAGSRARNASSPRAT